MAQSKAGVVTQCFPSPVTKKLSALYIQRLIGLTISTITWARKIFPQECYVPKFVDSIPMKILRKGNAESERLLSLLVSSFEAIDKGYLKQFIFAIHEGSPVGSVLETYTFRIKYSDGLDDLDCIFEDKLSGIQRGFQADLAGGINKVLHNSTIKMLRACLQLTGFAALPSNRAINVKLLYTDSTPLSYEPSGFRAVNSLDYVYTAEKIPKKLTLGKVETKFHVAKLEMRSVYYDGNVCLEEECSDSNSSNDTDCVSLVKHSEKKQESSSAKHNECDILLNSPIQNNLMGQKHKPITQDLFEPSTVNSKVPNVVTNVNCIDSDLSCKKTDTALDQMDQSIPDSPADSISSPYHEAVDSHINVNTEVPKLDSNMNQSLPVMQNKIRSDSICSGMDHLVLDCNGIFTSTARTSLDSTISYPNASCIDSSGTCTNYTNFRNVSSSPDFTVTKAVADIHAPPAELKTNEEISNMQDPSIVNTNLLSSSDVSIGSEETNMKLTNNSNKMEPVSSHVSSGSTKFTNNEEPNISPSSVQGVQETFDHGQDKKTNRNRNKRGRKKAVKRPPASEITGQGLKKKQKLETVISEKEVLPYSPDNYLPVTSGEKSSLCVLGRESVRPVTARSKRKVSFADDFCDQVVPADAENINSKSVQEAGNEKYRMSSSAVVLADSENRNSEIVREPVKVGNEKYRKSSSAIVLNRASPVRAARKVSVVSLSSTPESNIRTVICECQNREDFGVMIKCSYCSSWQHAVCYGILDDDFNGIHCCLKCSIEDPSRICTDTSLVGLSKPKLVAKCSYRRSLVLCKHLNSIGANDFTEILQFNPNSADAIIKILQNAKVLPPGSPKEKMPVDKYVLITTLFPKEFNLRM